MTAENPVAEGLMVAVEKGLAIFVDGARAAFGADLKSIVLYGSAAQGAVRATSDVNVIVLLARFDPGRADALREPLRVAHAAIGLTVMFVLEGELTEAASAFAVKFADIVRRRRVLFGDDPFKNLALPREAELRRLRQVLLNLALRLRERYLLTSLREEQAARAIADAAGPLRACAAALRELEGLATSDPKTALVEFVKATGNAAWGGTLARISIARETGHLPPGIAGPALLDLLEITGALRAHALSLPERRP